MRLGRAMFGTGIDP